jgi:hypothetical protein
MADGDGLTYPNPGSGKEWTDVQGRVWRRRGESPGALDEKRTRTLLRRGGVPLATWRAGSVEWYESPDQKQSAAERLNDLAERSEDVVASEWKADDGTVMLLLEHHC